MEPSDHSNGHKFESIQAAFQTLKTVKTNPKKPLAKD